MKHRTRPSDRNYIQNFTLHGAEERARRAVNARKTRGLKTDGRGHPTTTDIDYTEAETEFFMAVDAWKNRTGRRFPTLGEILMIARSIGYHQDDDQDDAYRIEASVAA
jgi:hypothetical protein